MSKIESVQVITIEAKQLCALFVENGNVIFFQTFDSNIQSFAEKKSFPVESVDPNAVARKETHQTIYAESASSINNLNFFSEFILSVRLSFRANSFIVGTSSLILIPTSSFVV